MTLKEAEHTNDLYSTYNESLTDLFDIIKENENFEAQKSNDDLTNFKEIDFSQLLISSKNRTPLLGPARIKLLKSFGKTKFCSLDFPRVKIYPLLQMFAESFYMQEHCRCCFILPHMPTTIFFETDDLDCINEIHPFFHTKNIAPDFVFRNFMHIWLTDILKHIFNTFGSMTCGYYQNDICQILDVDLTKKEAIVRVIPRLQIECLGRTYDTPKLFDSEEFDQYDLLLTSQPKKILYDGSKKIICRGYKGMWFSGGFLLTKVKINCIDFNVEPTEEQREMFEKDKMMLCTNEERVAVEEIDWPTDRYQKIIKFMRDRNEIDFDKHGIVLKKMDPRSQIAATNEEKNYLLTTIEMEEKQAMSKFIIVKRPQTRKPKIPNSRQMTTDIQVYDSDPNSKENRLEKFQINKFSKKLVEGCKNASVHQAGQMVRLSDGFVGVITATNLEETVVLLFDNSARVIPSFSQISIQKEDSSVRDADKNRLFKGDEVDVINNKEYSGFSGIISHVFDHYVFGRFTDNGENAHQIWLPCDNVKMKSD